MRKLLLIFISLMLLIIQSDSELEDHQLTESKLIMCFWGLVLAEKLRFYSDICTKNWRMGTSNLNVYISLPLVNRILSDSGWSTNFKSALLTEYLAPYLKCGVHYQEILSILITLALNKRAEVFPILFKTHRVFSVQRTVLPQQNMGVCGFTPCHNFFMVECYGLICV